MHMKEVFGLNKSYTVDFTVGFMTAIQHAKSIL